MGGRIVYYLSFLPTASLSPYYLALEIMGGKWQWLTFPFPFVHSPSFSEHIFVEDRIKDYQPVETRTQDGWPRQRYEMKKMAMERVYERERERERRRKD